MAQVSVMAPESVPASNQMSVSDTIVFDELDYQRYGTSHGTYQLSKIIQQTNGQTVPGGLTSVGGQESIFELPGTNAFNFAESYLYYTVTPIAGGASNYNFVFNDTVAEIREIELYTRSGSYFVRIQDMNVYLNLMLRATTQLNNLLSSDDVLVWEGLQTCSNAITAVGGQTLADTIIPPLSTVTIDKTTTPNYYISGAVNSAFPVYTRRFPLSVFRDTILAENKSLYFGGEILYLRIVWSPLGRVMYCGQSITNLSTTTSNAQDGAGISNLTLYLAIEKNPDVQRMLKAQVEAGTFKILVPFVYQSKITLTGSTHTITQRYNSAHGRRLKKIIVAPFNTAQTNQTAYDHSNYPGSAKIQQFYTQLDNNRTSQYDYVSANYDEWMVMGKKLKGSCIQSASDYYANYFWMEDFTNNLSVGNRHTVKPENNQVDGLDLLNGEHKYEYFATLPASATYMWYIFGITMRELHIQPGILTFQ